MSFRSLSSLYINSFLFCSGIAVAQAPNLAFLRSGQATTAAGINLSSNELVSDPTIIYDSGRYKMWYTSVTGAYTAQQVMGIAYAESTDGRMWTPRLNTQTGEPNLVLRPTVGGWDARGVETASVVRTPTGKYWMYYSGDLSNGSNTWAIGLAQSNDGITWTKVGSGPVLRGRATWEGPFFDGEMTGGVCEPSVLYDASKGIFRMWYAALGIRSGVLAYRLGYASSVDGIKWTAQANPVIEPGAGSAWDNLIISQVSVAKDSKTGYLHLFYFGTSVNDYLESAQLGAASTIGSLGYAFSKDGTTWQKAPAPVLSRTPNTWEHWTVAGPAALIENDTLKLWYHASPSPETYSGRFGLATAQIPR